MLLLLLKYCHNQVIIVCFFIFIYCFNRLNNNLNITHMKLIVDFNAWNFLLFSLISIH